MTHTEKILTDKLNTIQNRLSAIPDGVYTTDHLELIMTNKLLDVLDWTLYSLAIKLGLAMEQ